MFTLSRSLLISAILFCTTFSGAEDLSLSYAERFFNSGNYYNAITEYKRFIFFNSNFRNENVSYAYYKIGLAYRNQKKWDECIEAFQKSIQTEVKESIRDEKKIALAVALISSGNHSASEFLLLEVEMFTHFPELRRKAAFFRGVSALYSFKWKEARESFHVYFNNSKSKSQEISTQVNSLLAKAQDFKYKSPKLAKTLSTILPGSGQIYSGDWRNGINALLINTATGYLLVKSLLSLQYQGALFYSLFLFGRFYRGNRYRAEEAAKKYNQSRNQKFAAQILEILKEK